MQVKASVLGHFGEGKNLLNGQTVKTKIITEELQNQLGQNQVMKFDTHGGWKTILKAPFQVFQALVKSSNVLIFPAQNGLRVYAPLLSFQKRFFKTRKIHYVVIGGWLPQFISERKGLAKTLKQFDGIYVETKTMKSALESQGFTNVFVMPNCKKLKILSEDELVYPIGVPYKICTFSRVMREKGIEDAVNAVKFANDSIGIHAFSLDIYGQVDSAQIKWFDNLQKTFPPFIRYKGLVPFEKSVDVLKYYFALLFPTYYEGEGFAGTIIDAYSAGVPVIASDWKYNSELVNADVGYVYPTRNQTELVDLLKKAAENPKVLLGMKSFCLAEAQKYRIDKAIRVLVDKLDSGKRHHMKRLLCILSGMNAGGAETFIMKIYRNLDRTKYQIDFCINVKERCFYEDEIMSMGGKLYRIPSKTENLIQFRRQLANIVRSNSYHHVLRITSNALGFMDLKIAKKSGAVVCCARSSNSSDGGDFKSILFHKIGKLLYGRYADVKIAPSDLAAKYTFGNKAYENGEVSILHNGIDLAVYRYSPEHREAVRREFSVDKNTKLIGHIGRFDEQKNHMFLLEVFHAIQQTAPDAKLILIGNGKLEESIRQRAAELGITEKIIFAGVRPDIPHLLCAMDVFVFPSLYEGMPNTVIEAQAVGLPCVIADTITREADISGLIEYLPLGDAAAWAEKALSVAGSNRVETHGRFIEHQYDIESVTEQFTRLIYDACELR